MSSKSLTVSTLSRSKGSRRRGTTLLAGSPRLDGPTRPARSRSSPSRATAGGASTGAARARHSRRRGTLGERRDRGANCEDARRGGARRRRALPAPRRSPHRGARAARLRGACRNDPGAAAVEARGNGEAEALWCGPSAAAGAAGETRCSRARTRGRRGRTLGRRGARARRGRGRPTEGAAGLGLVCGRLVDDRIGREALGGLPSLVCDLFLQLYELVLVREPTLSLSILLVGHSLLVPTRSTL